MIRLAFHVDSHIVSKFTPLVEKGIVLPADTGCSLKAFLCGQLGLSEEYLDQRIQTLFLDFRPVDDVDEAVVKDGAIVALSAAMPGLLGATMRKGGRYAAFRKDISVQEDTASKIEKKKGRVTIKLFNMVAKEVGGHLLQKGVEIEGGNLSRFLQNNHDALVSGIRKVIVDGQETTINQRLMDRLAIDRVWFTLFV